jgi:hypothetical protein
LAVVATRATKTTPPAIEACYCSWQDYQSDAAATAGRDVKCRIYIKVHPGIQHPVHYHTYLLSPTSQPKRIGYHNIVYMRVLYYSYPAEKWRGT